MVTQLDLVKILKSNFNCNNKKIVKILKIINEKNNKDNKIYTMFLNYKEYVNSTQISKSRRPNFPSEISENLIKYYAEKYENKIYSWKEKPGDLYCEKTKEYIEVKCFSSTGPSSFGPKEKWDLIYFIDAINFKNDIFIIYKINLNNEEFHKKIMVNKNETSYNQCLCGKRPRIKFCIIKNQIPEFINEVYNGTIQNLLFDFEEK